MMRFVYPHLLWLLALLPLLAFFKGKRGPAPALLFSTVTVLALLSEGRKIRPGGLLVALRLFSLALLIVALARPQLGNTTTEIEASGIDILLAVDVSGSMEALDFTLQGNTVNRLEVVKSVIQQFVDQRPNDRIGLLAFGGRPYQVSPLTLDHDWLLKRLASLSVGMVEDGTAIGSAIGVGVNRLQDKEAKSRILILLTDGVNNVGAVPPLVAAEAAQTLGIKVYTIGAGTKGEAPMPVVDAFGRKRLMRAKVDIDDETLGKVAEMTGARYFRATDTPSLEKVYEEINKMETTTRSIKKFENYRELFPWLVLVAILLMGVEVSIRERRLP
jgi:Ca-activated chloride channel family protein